VAIVPVSEAEDHRLDDYRDLRDADAARGRGVFIAEGRLVVRRLLASERFVTRSVMVTETALAALLRDGAIAAARHADVPVFVVPPATLERVAGFDVHRGCLALGERPPGADWRTLIARARRLVVLEAVGDADNVGAVFRHAAAFDAGAVLLGPACADPLYRKAIRTSMGASLAVPFAHLAPWPDALDGFDRRRFSLVAMTPARHAVPLADVARQTSGRAIVLVAGHEGDGLTAAALAACDHLARIPISPAVDSLNVAAAVAIGLYAIAAQQDE
jgi:tRNA G18 (ribose-2'-O)-methylase SpoU